MLFMKELRLHDFFSLRSRFVSRLVSSSSFVLLLFAVVEVIIFIIVERDALSFADGRVGVGLFLALPGLFYGLSRLAATCLGLLLQEGLKGGGARSLRQARWPELRERSR